jgi:two-component system, chemotaxis family, chemotaxis protein CheY
MKSVLIVDDAVFMRNTLKLMLERNGFNVVGDAENGAVAVKKYSDLLPNIVTLDITMPVMDGIQALKEIKKLDPKATVIMISAMGQEVYVKECIIAGAKGFLLKPFNEDQVVSTFSKL